MSNEFRNESALTGSQLLPPNSSLITILQWRSVHQPERVACRFLPNEQGSAAQSQSVGWSYAELHRRAGEIATQLQGLVNQNVMLVYPAGLDFVAALFGCLYAGAVAVPAPPPGRHQSLARWRHIVADSQPQVILTTQRQLPKLQSFLESFHEQLPHKIACFDPYLTFSEALTQPWQSSDIDLDEIALLQYTSGSTSQPRGVMVSHRNLVHNLALIYQHFGHSPESHGVIWLPPHHDMGLIGGILQPIYGGFPVTLMSPESFLRQPIRWLQAISDLGGTTSGGPNFAYERCLQKITPEQRQNLDLSCWELAFTGAEPIRAQTLRQFADIFAECGFRPNAFYPCYGLAEATLFVTGGSKHEALTTCTVNKQALAQGQVVDASANKAAPVDAVTIVSCSRAAADQRLLIVDPKTHHPCSVNQVGEIWLAGPSLAQGYWRQPEATRETFDACLADGAGPFLRTGDLGFVRNGELYVTGRLKDLIIIRGQNHYPQDIEQTVGQSHESVQAQSGAAFSLDVDGEERLVITQEVKRTALCSLNAASIIDAVRAAVSRQHGLQVYAVVLLKPGSLPKTTSGKVQRHACKAGFQSKTLDVVSQWAIDEPVEDPADDPIDNTEDLDRCQMQESRHSEPLINQQDSSGVTPSHVDILLQWLRQYASESINSRLMDERRCVSPGVVLDFGNRGLLGMQIPAEYGGLGLGHGDMLRVLEQLGAINPTLALFVGLNNVLGIRPILQAAHPDVQAAWLPRLATGRELAAFALTEPGAGSNPNAIRSRVSIDLENRWRLHGEKIWSGSAAWAGIINVFVQHPEASGISGFVISKGTPGLRQGPEALTMGMRGMVQNAVYLDAVPVSETQLLGQPGAGMVIAQDAMMHGRLAIAAACIGGMKRCAQLMLRYSSRRSVSTGKLLENPVVLTRLGGLTAKISALSALVDWMAQQLDSGDGIPSEAYAACKILAPEFYWQAADDLVQCLGGRGYIETNQAPQILRDARVLRIFEGPTETLAMYLGARALDLRSGLRTLLSKDLGTPEVAEKLFIGAEGILARYRHAQADAVMARRSACLAVGELGAIAILLATVKNSSEVSSRVREWAQLYFEQVLAQALKPTPEEFAAASAADTTAWIAGYTDTIGDIEQAMEGEDHSLDALLHKEVYQSVNAHFSQAEPSSSKRPSSFGNASHLTQNQSLTANSLENWMIQWLASHLKLPTSSIDPNRPFADYGVDSVMAVELAQDLEDFLHLQHPLDATLAWNFPTISTLAAQLAFQTASDLNSRLMAAPAKPSPHEFRASSRLPSPSSKGVATDSDSLDGLSEAEIADVLAAELAGMGGERS